MKKIASILLVLLALAMPTRASTVAASTASVTISGQTITYNVAPAQATPYYRLAYDSTTLKVSTVIYSKGTTRTVYTLFCATTWAEIQAQAATLNLTGLPSKDPANP